MSTNFTDTEVAQSLNSPFFPPHIRAEPGRAKEESRITCMRMLRTPPFSPPPPPPCQLIPDQLNLTSASLNHIQFVFHNIKRKKSLPRFVDHWKHRLGLGSARAVLCKWALCTRQTFLSKTFAKSLNIQKQYGKKCLGKEWRVLVVDNSKDRHKPYFDFYVFMFFFFSTISTSKKMFSFRARAEKGIARHILTRAAWLGPKHFWLVRSEHAHASYPGLFFRPPGFSPYLGREERRV